VEELTVCAWRWGEKYGPHYVERVAAGLHRHLATPFSFRVFTPDPADVALTEVPGCFARLRMFDPAWQIANGVRGRLVCLDLDLVVAGALDGLFDRPEPFVILQGVNASNPCPFNGSVMMLRTGYRPDVWSDFSLGAARKVPFDSFPDDQAWLAHKLPDAGAFTDADGVYAFQKRGWPRGEALPRNARIVAFPGWRDPAGFTHLDWVKEHWRA
jgi:hypothetical protein